MPHVALVPFTGFRLREEGMLALGMSLPGLKSRAKAISQLPALGLLTLAGLNPPDWECSYHEAAPPHSALADEVMSHRPTLVAISALTASVEEAYRFSALLRRRGARSCSADCTPQFAPRRPAAMLTRSWSAKASRSGELLHDAANGALRPIYHPIRHLISPIRRYRVSI